MNRYIPAFVALSVMALTPGGRASSTTASAAQTPLAPRELVSIGRAVLLPDDATPSPDGEFLAISRTGGLAVRHRRTSDVRVLLNEVRRGDGVCNLPKPAWSSDSSQLAYGWCLTAEGRRFTEVRTIGRDGRGDRVVLPRTEDSFSALDWSRDGRTIAVSFQKPGVQRFDASSLFSIGVIDVRTGALRELNTGIGQPGGLAFSPDGRLLAYTRFVTGPRNVFVLPLDGGGERPLFPDSSHSNQFQGWTPDRRGVLFTSNRSGTSDLWRVDTNERGSAGVPSLLVRDAGGVQFRGVTKAGDLFYFASKEGDRSDVYLVAVNPQTGQVEGRPRAISHYQGTSSNPIWSADGRQLAFRSGSDRAISILNMNTGEERRLQPSVPGPRFDWSPDQRFFLVGGGGVRLDAETGARTVISGVGGEHPRWSPNGRSVTYRTFTQEGASIEMWDLSEDGLSGRNGRVIVKAGDQSIRCYAISPDSAHVAWIAIDDNTLTLTEIRSGTTRVLRQIQNPQPDDVLSWSPDGKYVVFSDTTAATTVGPTTHKQSELWRIRVSDGAPEKLGLTLDIIESPSFSPDGRFLAFSAKRHGPGGLFVIEKLLTGPAAD